jgi:hypothetical protein
MSAFLDFFYGFVTTTCIDSNITEETTNERLYR